MAYVKVEIDANEFDDAELVDELESRGYQCTKSELKVISGISRVEHLAMCGLTSAALAELISIAEESMGIRLR
jgi:hypothetical protein